MSYNDIAEHFLATAENLYRILFLEREAQKRSDLAQQLSHALLFTSYYYKSIGRHEAHKLMMQDASTIISNMESYVDRYTAFVWVDSIFCCVFGLDLILVFRFSELTSASF